MLVYEFVAADLAIASSTVLAWDPDVMSHNQPANVVDYMTHVRSDGASVHFDDHYVT